MSNVETLQQAIEALECLQKERGVVNGWLYEVDQDTLKRYPEENPRVPLVQGGPDVMLMRTVEPMLSLLRADYEVCDRNGWIPDRHVLAIARAVVGEAE